MTFTPETAAPVESVTVPRIEVDVVCANSSAQTRSDVPTNRKLFMLILSRKMRCNKNIRSGRKCQYKDTGTGRGPRASQQGACQSTRGGALRQHRRCDWCWSEAFDLRRGGSFDNTTPIAAHRRAR